MNDRNADRKLIELEARLVAVPAKADDALRCGHPRGALQCRFLHACEACPFAERVELAPAA